MKRKTPRIMWIGLALGLVVFMLQASERGIGVEARMAGIITASIFGLLPALVVHRR